MKYVAVVSSNPGIEVFNPIFNYFDDYLITLGEPTTTKNWDYVKILLHAEKIIKKEKLDKNKNLFIDSGGFQIIKGHIPASRVKEYIQCYHDIIKTYNEDLYKIFSLDIFNYKNTNEQNFSLNDYSLKQTINLIKENKKLDQKILFVIQSRNLNLFTNWRKLMIQNQVFDYFKKWSIGGLVGLKKETNASFSHAVPITLWLLAYAKYFKGDYKCIEQVHWLGQSSKLAFISMALIEKKYGVDMTADSSEIIRFAPVEQKMPFLFFDDESNDYVLAKNHKNIEKMLTKHSLGENHIYKSIIKFNNYALNNDNIDTDIDHQELELNDDHQELEFEKRLSKLKNSKKDFKMDNDDIIELQSQNIFYTIQFSNLIADKILTKVLEKPTKEWEIKDVEDLHPILKSGRLAKEIFNNLKFFEDFDPILNKDILTEMDLKVCDNIILKMIKSYNV